MLRRSLAPEQLASIREAVVRGVRALAAYVRGEGPAPRFEKPCSMPVDPESSPRQRDRENHRT